MNNVFGVVIFILLRLQQLVNNIIPVMVISGDILTKYMEHTHQNSYIATDTGLFCTECGFLDEYIDMNNFSTQFKMLSDEPYDELKLNTNIDQTGLK